MQHAGAFHLEKPEEKLYNIDFSRAHLQSGFKGNKRKNRRQHAELIAEVDKFPKDIQALVERTRAVEVELVQLRERRAFISEFIAGEV